MAKAKTVLSQLKQKTKSLVKRGLDQQVRLAVTGLSGAGKTAFITSLINQLIYCDEPGNLAFLGAKREGRLLGAKRVAQQNLHLARFDYEGAMASLGADPARWPESTRGVSEIRLAIRYKTSHPLKRQLAEVQTLYLDIIDYPGEWLMDLPMLEQDYASWCQSMLVLLKQPGREEHSQAFFEAIAELDLTADCDEVELQRISAIYTELLQVLKREQGLSLIQPGRFILPGELEGAPLLQFFPIDIDKFDASLGSDGETTNLDMLKARFAEYKERVVKGFYKTYFTEFDRQIVLVDCLGALNKQQAGLTDLQDALGLLQQSFQYGESHLLRRLFSPRIDKVLFAASKSDHVTRDQDQNLLSLLSDLISETQREARFEGIETELMAISSIRATESGSVEHKGKRFPSLRGMSLPDNEWVTLYPGDVPDTVPDAAFWQQSRCDYLGFAPQQSSARGPLPHLRMDQALEFLIGDKLL